MGLERENGMTSRIVGLVNHWDEETRWTQEERAVILGLSFTELGERFDLDLNESGMFWYIIREVETVEYCAYGVEEKNGAVFLEQVQEAVHQEFDGPWTPYDRMVIRTFLADVTWATYQVLKDREKG